MKKYNLKPIHKLLNSFDELFQLKNYDRVLCVAKYDDGETTADIAFSENYMQMTIRLYPKFFLQDKETQRKDILHEICHTITNPMHEIVLSMLDGKLMTKSISRETLEKATCQIENIVDLLLRNRRADVKKAYADYK